MEKTVKNFLGREIAIPGDRLYEPEEGLWIKKTDTGRFDVGLAEPALLMGGTVREVEFLVASGSEVRLGETIVLILTSKLKYVAAPLSGVLVFPEDTGSLPDKIVGNPYGSVLFSIATQTDQAEALVDSAGYADVLLNSEGARNPGGHKGGVSPTCKAVYAGLAAQKIKEGV